MKSRSFIIPLAMLLTTACDRDPTFVTTKERPGPVSYAYVRAEGNIIIKEDGYVGPVALICESGSATGRAEGEWSGWYSIMVRLEKAQPSSVEPCRLDIGQPVTLSRNLELPTATRPDSVVTTRFNVEVPPDTPQAVRMELPLRGLAAGASHSCAVSTSGVTYCWGGNRNGQLGVGSRVATRHPVRTLFTEGARSISAYGVTTCVLRNDGRAFCWGTLNEQRTPQPWSTQLTFTDFKTGGQNCGSSGGLLYCAQELGEPLVMPGLPSVRAHDSGSFFGCAVVTEHSLYCWGSNAFGQLGTGPTGSMAQATTPTRIDHAARFDKIAAGRRHTCALDESGRAYCWGSGTFGQLGRSQVAEPCYDQNQNPFPCSGTDISPQPVSTDLRFISIDTQLDHTCAITTANVLYCWGKGTDGQLGSGSNVNSMVPLEVQANGLRFTAVATGERHTCAISTTGKAFCWGYGGDGALGVGTTVTSNVPILVWGQE